MRRRRRCPSRRAGAGPCRRCCPRRRPSPPRGRRSSPPDWRPCPSARSTARRPARATEPFEPAPSPGPGRPTTRDSAHRIPQRRPDGCEKVASPRCPSGLAIRTLDKSYLPSSEGHSRYTAPSTVPRPSVDRGLATPIPAGATGPQRLRVTSTIFGSRPALFTWNREEPVCVGISVMRFSHQESVPVEGRDRRRWPSLQRVVRDFERGPSEQAPAKRHSALGRLTALACRDASLARPWTANPGEKTSLYEGAEREARNLFELQLQRLNLSKEQIAEQDPEQLKASLVQIDEAVANSQAFGVVSVPLHITGSRTWSRRPRLVATAEIGVLSVLLERR